MDLYIASLVHELKVFYGDLLYDIEEYPNIQSHLSALAQRMYEGVQQNHPFIISEISNYNKQYLGKKELIDKKTFSLQDCEQTIANEYGFDDWSTLCQIENLKYDNDFERAVNYLLGGDIDSLKDLITTQPQLLHARSKYGHGATLLNYAGSNGVEFWRQQVPSNLGEIVAYLLDAGVDKGAKMKVYGGEFDTYQLLVTSIHPLKAGIMEEMKSLLQP